MIYYRHYLHDDSHIQLFHLYGDGLVPMWSDKWVSTVLSQLRSDVDVVTKHKQIPHLIPRLSPLCPTWERAWNGFTVLVRGLHALSQPLESPIHDMTYRRYLFCLRIKFCHYTPPYITHNILWRITENLIRMKFTSYDYLLTTFVPVPRFLRHLICIDTSFCQIISSFFESMMTSCYCWSTLAKSDWLMQPYSLVPRPFPPPVCWKWWLAVCLSLDVFMSVLEWQRVILEDGCHHTIVWQRYCRMLTFRTCKPHP